MAHLWVRDQSSEWLVLPLHDEALDLDSIRDPTGDRTRGADAQDGDARSADAQPAVLLRAQGPPDERWAVISSPDRRIRINGHSVNSGIRVLHDRDELDVGGLGNVYFSTEMLARVKPFLDQGVSYAAINYRLTGVAPLPAPVHDAARAIQFLRAQAEKWNINADRIALTGGSAGACTSMWILLHDDLADPQAKDPVLQQSARVRPEYFVKRRRQGPEVC